MVNLRSYFYHTDTSGIRFTDPATIGPRVLVKAFGVMFHNNPHLEVHTKPFLNPRGRHAWMGHNGFEDCNSLCDIFSSHGPPALRVTVHIIECRGIMEDGNGLGSWEDGDMTNQKIAQTIAGFIKWLPLQLRKLLQRQYTNEIYKDKRLSFMAVLAKEMFPEYPGFDLFREGTDGSTVIQDAVKFGSTRCLSTYRIAIFRRASSSFFFFDATGNSTRLMSENVGILLEKAWGDEPNWHNVVTKSSVHEIIGHISALLFYGPELSKNQEWLEVTEEYTSIGFEAARELRLWPHIFRPFIHWFLPSCRRLRYLARRTRSLIEPGIAARERENSRREAEGQEPLTYDDAIEWTKKAAKGRQYDAAMSPLLFSINALHTTTDLLTQTLLDLSTRPELIQALREEVISVQPQEKGWKNSILGQLRLMDSAVKESQRLKPTESSIPYEKVRDARHYLRGWHPNSQRTVLGIPIFNMRNSEIYPNPDTYDGHRFMKMRKETGSDGVSQLVATSPIHLGFGHGIHACPGRFLAATQVKIILSHMVMKYDFKLGDGSETKFDSFGIELISNSEATLAVRRREDEVKF
ncbi:cytochrome P450 monooxygenase [Penicillium samsonianum]|uniref:cytochrome P450 monooxygenase n=1 Tax=Penicillium samsonianum TaxID=1882272 RepID=UPI0025478261|nr:cytochrome P450 monooxygenase [Penicillium samsonianum]KAJ6118934.1 cytochrome P450 monooxygenase [Penicillium samsonianum]